MSKAVVRRNGIVYLDDAVIGKVSQLDPWMRPTSERVWQATRRGFRIGLFSTRRDAVAALVRNIGGAR